jgi:cell fate regulator YaaT (PSP1 superfamily)
MGCASCGSANGSPGGCQNNGHCASGGCNRMNTYDWLAMMDIHDPSGFRVVEISYKNGARKEFCHCPEYLQAQSGDMVVVDEGNGFNIGMVSLTGELVRLQMRKKNFPEDRFLHAVVRKTNDRDLERLSESRNQEKPTLVRARAISRSLGLNMKIADVEFRGDGRKATFYYTADGRVDFRELVRGYAREFRIKVEMRQIGARQESARIGGLGSCGRELCCSTWLTDFKSVNTSAARYQNLSINQTKLSGQCGRLKCCLNYELDTYLDALHDFPDNVDVLYTKKGKANLVKTDIFKKLIYYTIEQERGRSNIIAVPLARIQEIKAMNKRNERPEELLIPETDEHGEEVRRVDFEDVTGAVELHEEKRRRRNKRKKSKGSAAATPPVAPSAQNPRPQQQQQQQREGGSRRDRQRHFKKKHAKPRGSDQPPKTD